MHADTRLHGRCFVSASAYECARHDIFAEALEEPDVDRSYLRHAIEAAFHDMQRRVVGIGMMHLRRDDFLGHTVPDPPLVVQRRVGAYLDWVEAGCSGEKPALVTELAAEDAAVDSLRRLVAQVEELDGLQSDAPRESDGLLGAWLNELVRRSTELGELERVLAAKPRNGWSALCDNAPDGNPVLTLSAVTGFYFNPAAFKRTSLPVEEDAHYWVKPGDLLMTRSNTPELVGHAAIYDGTPSPCIYPDLMMRLPLDRAVADTRFVWYWLQTPLVRDYIRRSAQGTSPTMKKINQKHVMAIPFPEALSLEEQRRLAQELDAAASTLHSLAKLYATVREEIDALIPSLLDRAFEGELGQEAVTA